MTIELRCPSCGHEWETYGEQTIDRHPYGDGYAEERGVEFDPSCPECGEEGDEIGSYEPEYGAYEEYDV